MRRFASVYKSIKERKTVFLTLLPGKRTCLGCSKTICKVKFRCAELLRAGEQESGTEGKVVNALLPVLSA